MRREEVILSKSSAKQSTFIREAKYSQGTCSDWKFLTELWKPDNILAILQTSLNCQAKHQLHVNGNQQSLFLHMLLQTYQVLLLIHSQSIMYQSTLLKYSFGFTQTWERGSLLNLTLVPKARSIIFYTVPSLKIKEKQMRINQ